MVAAPVAEIRDLRRPAPERLTLAEAYALSPGDYVDHRDTVGKWITARVEKKKEDLLLLHYEGWHELNI